MAQQINLSPEQEFSELLLANLPPVIARCSVEQALGGIVTPKTLANADSAGLGPAGAYQFGRKVVYPAQTLVDWLIKTYGVCRLKNNLKHDL